MIRLNDEECYIVNPDKIMAVFRQSWPIYEPHDNWILRILGVDKPSGRFRYVLTIQFDGKVTHHLFYGERFKDRDGDLLAILCATLNGRDDGISHTATA